jgi:hypothetical protein
MLQPSLSLVLLQMKASGVTIVDCGTITLRGVEVRCGLFFSFFFDGSDGRFGVVDAEALEEDIGIAMTSNKVEPMFQYAQVFIGPVGSQHH